MTVLVVPDIFVRNLSKNSDEIKITDFLFLQSWLKQQSEGDEVSISSRDEDSRFSLHLKIIKTTGKKNEEGPKKK